MKYIVLVWLFAVSFQASLASDTIEVMATDAEALYTALGVAGASTSVDQQNDSKRVRYANQVTCTQSLALKPKSPTDKPLLYVSPSCSLKTGNRRMAVDLNPAISDLIYRTLKNANADIVLSRRGSVRTITSNGIYCEVESEWNRDVEFENDPNSLAETFRCSIKIP